MGYVQYAVNNGMFCFYTWILQHKMHLKNKMKLMKNLTELLNLGHWSMNYCISYGSKLCSDMIPMH